MPKQKTKPDLGFARLTADRLDHYRTAPSGPVDFIEEQTVCRDAFSGGRTWTRPRLTALQRQVVTDVLTTTDDRGELAYTTMLLSWARKMAKTWLASAMWAYRACVWPNELILLSGPTRDAARELSYTAIVDTFSHNAALAKAVGADVQKGVIRVRATGSEVRAVSRTLGAQAGADWTVCHVDELWAWQGNQLIEFYRTITTPSPARRSPLLCVTSYAPIRGRSLLLQQLLARAKKKEKGLYSSIVSGVDEIVAACPWITREFLSQMKRTQNGRTYRRVFLNLPTADTDDDERYCFSASQIEACTDPQWRRQEARPEHATGSVILGVDFAHKHDCSAVAALSKMRDGTIALLDLHAKHGSRKDPLPASWVTDTLHALIARYGRVRVMADPTGLTEEIPKWRREGIDVTELRQQGSRLADALYRAIAGRRLRLYHDAGTVVLPDDRTYSLHDELRHLLYDVETRVLGHEGEGTKPGRHFDDRCTAIALALLAPELDAARATTLSFNVSKWFEIEETDQMERRRMFAPPTHREWAPGDARLALPAVGGGLDFGFRLP